MVKNQKVLITGSAGFVGRHFDAVLSARGDDIRRVDIRDAVTPTDCRDFFRYNDESYDLVIHLAAVVGGRANIEGDPLAVAQNLAIDSDMFRWAICTQPERVIYFSSSAAYPIYLQDSHHNVKLDENTIPDLTLAEWFGTPDQTYGWAKLTGEMLAEHARTEGVKVQVFRPFSGYGGDQHRSYPFPKFIHRAL
jgi:nucleoside-diphosphate-sugar epimerase